MQPQTPNPRCPRQQPGSHQVRIPTSHVVWRRTHPPSDQICRSLQRTTRNKTRTANAQHSAVYGPREIHAQDPYQQNSGVRVFESEWCSLKRTKTSKAWPLDNVRAGP